MEAATRGIAATARLGKVESYGNIWHGSKNVRLALIASNATRNRNDKSRRTKCPDDENRECSIAVNGDRFAYT